MLGEVPGATACQGSSLEDGGCLQKKKNIKYIEKKKEEEEEAGTPLQRAAVFSLLFCFIISLC